MKFKMLTTLVALLAVLAAGCGGTSADDQAVIDAIANQMRSDGAEAGPIDIDCMAEAMVTGLGGAEVMEQEYGLTAETIAAGQSPDGLQLPRDKAISLADQTMDCGMVDMMLAEMTADGLPSEVADCLVDNLDRDPIRDMFAAEMMNEADADAVGEAAETAMFGSMFDAMASCDINPADLDF